MQIAAAVKDEDMAVAQKNKRMRAVVGRERTRGEPKVDRLGIAAEVALTGVQCQDRLSDVKALRNCADVLT